MSLLTRKGRSLWGLIVFAFPQDKESFFEIHRTQKKRFSFSRSLRVLPSLTWRLATVLIARFHYYDGCLERRTVDSSKIQTNFLRAMSCFRRGPCSAGTVRV